MNKERLIVLSLVIVAAAAARLLPHAPNVTPIAAMALFSGMYVTHRGLAFLLPLAAMLVSDMVIGFHSSMWAVYLAFMITVIIGFNLRARHSALSIAGGTLGASVLFFVLTNLSVWLSGEIYPLTHEGLITCFVAAIPFFANTLVGNAFYTALLFTGFALAQKRYSILREA